MYGYGVDMVLIWCWYGVDMVLIIIIHTSIFYFHTAQCST